VIPNGVGGKNMKKIHPESIDHSEHRSDSDINK
jgi:hypothetical protein